MESLFFRKLNEGSPIIILHGLFGTSDNWMNIAKQLSEHHEVYVVDLPNHGLSFHDDSFDYPSMSNHLKEFIEEQNLQPCSIVGHSMGGKVAMNLAVQHPELLYKLVVVDIGTKQYQVHHQQILDGLNSIPISELQSRGQADEILGKTVKDPAIRQFLLKNLQRNPAGGFKWKMNLKVITDQIENVGKGLDPEDHYEGETLFVYGGRSEYVLPQDLEQIKQHFPKADFVRIADAGHWIHVDQTQEFISTLLRFLD